MAQVLRYPYTLLTDKTDYLQIDLVQRSFAGEKLIRDRGFAQNKRSGSIGVVKTLSQDFVTEKNDGIILLPIPSNISDSNSIQFSEDSLDQVTAIAGGKALKFMGSKTAEEIKTEVETSIKGLSGKGLDDIKNIYLGNLAAQAASIAGIGNLSLDQLLARSEGKIINPNMELLFKGPTIRAFNFSFKFTPRGRDEAKQVKLIIGSLKRHMTPVDAGTFLSTPNYFELRYKSGSKDHKFLHKFKQCVLQDMKVNYTGENTYATYYDGTPVSLIMDLTFKELEPIYRSDYNELGPDDGVGY